jgi:primosomal protein N'
MTLGLEPGREAAGPVVSADGLRLVEVAVDAAGAGGARPYTYAVPDNLADLEDGEAVLIEFGRRQALGVVLGPGTSAGGAAVKPIVDRVRADGPLLPGLTLSLARWISAHYLAPPALVIRAMLPPGLLERLDLVAEPTTRTCSTCSWRARDRPGSWPRPMGAPACCGVFGHSPARA